MTVFKDCPVCPEMVTLPAGRFVMGDDKGKKNREKPAHPVTIAKPFALGRFEVTFDQWRSCHDDGGCASMPDDHNWGRGRRPVINISYTDALAYVAWLKRITGKPYRLPSEAEWEYAARGGTRTNHWWGDSPERNRANCRGCDSQWSGYQTAPVGSFGANPFGLFDMLGNSREWVADCWFSSHQGAPGDARPRRKPSCHRHVIRGGSWYYTPYSARAAYRTSDDDSIESYLNGFRVARDLP